MKITLGDAGGEDEEPRWLIHTMEYLPHSPLWVWRQAWVGWRNKDMLRANGWSYRGHVFYRRWTLVPLWVSTAKLSRRLPPLNPSQAAAGATEASAAPNELR